MEAWRNDGNLQLEAEQHAIRAPVKVSASWVTRPCASGSPAEVWHALDSCELEEELQEIGHRIVETPHSRSFGTHSITFLLHHVLHLYNSLGLSRI